MLLAVALLRAAPVVAAGVVGTGTPESCIEAALDAALAGGGAVTFDCGPEPVTITLTSEKVIAAGTAPTAVDGGGLVTLSGGDAVRVFRVDEPGMLDVRNLTIADGFAGQEGGGIFNEGTLTITNSTLSENRAHHGGGIANAGTLTVTNSTFSENTAFVIATNPGSGGGIINYGTLTVTNSTFSGNRASFGGGGIASGFWTLTVTNSTFSENTADDLGGGIFNLGTLTVTNSTFSGNTSGRDEGGGGIFSSMFVFVDAPAGVVTNSTFFENGNVGTVGDLVGRLTNTIIANNTGGDCVKISGILTDGGHNLIEDAENACGLTSGVNDNIVGVDPMLDPEGLQDNGGLTQTIALLPDSPAIDAGDPEVCADPPVNGLDQRGFVRPGTGHTACSIGAYEADAVPSMVTATPTNTPITATPTDTPPTITATPSETSTTITPTAMPTATSTTIPATPTAKPSCTGDCDGNGVVEINELILGVNIALGLQPVGACPAFMNLDGMVSIAQLIKGVNNALGGCGIG